MRQHIKHYTIYLAITTLSLSLFLGCANIVDGGGTKLGPGDTAPAFTLNDTSGTPRALSDYIGSAVLLEFWASTCDGCNASMPDIQGYHAAYSGQGLVVLGVNLGESSSDISTYMSNGSYTFTALVDENSSSADLYEIKIIPSAVLIDETGIIRFLDETPGLTTTIIEQYLP
ncbi:MAG: TlpA family protein disulfide reductase [bacterium]|nr:TlpA family protein disulfide reductase [bacterium]